MKAKKLRKRTGKKPTPKWKFDMRERHIKSIDYENGNKTLILKMRRA